MNKRLIFFLIGLVLSFVILNIGQWIKSSQNALEKYFYAQISQPFQQIVKIEIPKKPNLDLQVKSAITVKINENNNGKKVLYQKFSEKKLAIASLTKLMTAIIVLENLENYSSSLSQELLNSMLIESNNEAAQDLAEIIGKTEFVNLMNKKAEILGLEKTSFTNSTGLETEESGDLINYSTAKDLVKLTQYILKKYPIIFEISSLQNKPLRKSDGTSYLAINTDELLGEIPNIFGGKTGWEDKAGGCMLLVLKDKQENNYLINVILGASSPTTRFEEMEKLVNWINIQ